VRGVSGVADTYVADTYVTVEGLIGPLFVAFGERGVTGVDQADDAQAFEAAYRARTGRDLVPAPEPPPELAAPLAQALADGCLGSLPVDLDDLSPFQQAVLRATAEIPLGEVRSYTWVARAIGRPGATRAVGTALARNPIPVLVPCHRVVRTGGSLGRYSMGEEGTKARLLAAERSLADVIGATDPTPAGRLEVREVREVGVGPHPRPWPDDARLDPELLAAGDRRNVIDRYRYWRRDAIVADLDERRHPFHVAVENWQHDLNIGTVVRNANAFLVGGVHIVGKRRWDRRGAMVTDRYQHVSHHPTVADLQAWAHCEGLAVVGIDVVPGAVAIESVELPERCVLVFGQEGPGLSPEALAACEVVCAITQFGSTRSINAGVASGIAMHAWIRQHADLAAGTAG
jgi:O-6-methylguanine DNA methyltransferase